MFQVAIVKVAWKCARSWTIFHSWWHLHSNSKRHLATSFNIACWLWKKGNATISFVTTRSRENYSNHFLQTFPLVYVLMTKRTIAAYKNVFRYINKKFIPLCMRPYVCVCVYLSRNSFYPHSHTLTVVTFRVCYYCLVHFIWISHFSFVLSFISCLFS